MTAGSGIGARRRHWTGAGPRPAISERFAAAQTFEEFLEGAQTLREFWHASAKRASVDPALGERVVATGRNWHLLVLNADWCGDSVNTVPYIARLAESAPNVKLRLLDRDENLDLMDAHLTERSRSIPRVLVLDENFRECATWGPRPAELQRWVRSHGMSLPRSDRYRETRIWYARDGGRTTVEELVALLESCASVEGAPKA
jgi:hypothetical protein